MTERHERLAGWIRRTYPGCRVAWETPTKAVILTKRGKIPAEMIGNGILCDGKMEVPASTLIY